MSALTRLVVDVVNEEGVTPDRHVEFFVSSEQTSAPIPRTKRDEANLRHTMVHMAGLLARVAARLQSALLMQGKLHRCDWMPCGFEVPDTEELDCLPGTECGVRVQVNTDRPIAGLSYRMPSIVITVPRNRERSWRQRIEDVLTEVVSTSAAPDWAADLPDE